jgi:hypothetical protein
MAASDLWSLLLLIIVVVLEAYALIQVCMRIPPIT